MRIYNIPVNADLLETVIPLNDPPLSNDALIELNQLANILHNIIEVEHYVKLTGALASAVHDRGIVYKIGEIW